MCHRIYLVSSAFLPAQPLWIWHLVLSDLVECDDAGQEFDSPTPVLVPEIDPGRL